MIKKLGMDLQIYINENDKKRGDKFISKQEEI